MNEELVAWLLARECPGNDCHAAELAVKRGQYDVLVRLLAQKPEILQETRGLLLEATKIGHEKLVTLLLERIPEQALTFDNFGQTTLYHAVTLGHAGIVMRLLVEDTWEWHHLLPQSGFGNALHKATRDGFEEIVEMVLAVLPELANGTGKASPVDGEGNTLLHLVAMKPNNKQHFARVFRMCNKKSLQVKNKQLWTPFKVAVRAKNEFAVQLLQWSTGFDEAMRAFDNCPPAHFRLCVERQCAGLLEALGPDLIAIVYAYLFARPRQQNESKQKRAAPQKEQLPTKPPRRRFLSFNSIAYIGKGHPLFPPR